MTFGVHSIFVLLIIFCCCFLFVCICLFVVVVVVVVFFPTTGQGTVADRSVGSGYCIIKINPLSLD